MNATCQPLPRSAIEDFLRDAARSLCERPTDTPAQKNQRLHRFAHTVLGFQPRDGLEYMMTTMTIGHCDVILDSMRDVLQGQVDPMKARTKAGIVGLSRSMRDMASDLHRALGRPLTEEAQREADARQAEAALAADHPTPAAQPAPASADPAAPGAGTPEVAVPQAGASRPVAPKPSAPRAGARQADAFPADISQAHASQAHASRADTSQADTSQAHASRDGTSRVDNPQVAAPERASPQAGRPQVGLQAADRRDVATSRLGDPSRAAQGGARPVAGPGPFVATGRAGAGSTTPRAVRSIAAADMTGARTGFPRGVPAGAHTGAHSGEDAGPGVDFAAMREALTILAETLEDARAHDEIPALAGAVGD